MWIFCFLVWKILSKNMCAIIDFLQDFDFVIMNNQSFMQFVESA
jgi:hypothetical protein